MKNFFLIIILFFSGFKIATAQNKTSPREMFLEAESYFLYEEYNEALPFYIQLSVLNPKNDNINYRLGRCYLNIPYEKEKAISYLEKASKNINLKHKGDNLKETSAPPDVIFYLADAYRINNQLEKAISQYKRFKQMSDPAVFDHLMIDDHIRACENAVKLVNNPVNVSYTNLGDVINSRFSENNPVLSGDESTLVYSVQLQFYPAVFFSVKKNGSWSPPVNINPDLGVDDDCYPVGLSYNGKELLLYRNNQYLGDLYVSRFIGGKWTKIKRLNSNINTRFWESHACFSRDGKKLYFTSNRKEGYGGLDIYFTTRSDIDQDNWGTAKNLGAEVNSPFNEETPFITPDERKIFFSSLGHNGMGGYDIFSSELNSDGSWGKPQNLGYPVNTTDHDLFFQPVKDGNEGYISMPGKDSYGRSDIYKIKILTPEIQLAAVNKTLKAPETKMPSSEINRDILVQDTENEKEKQAEFIALFTTNKNTELITKDRVSITQSEESDSKTNKKEATSEEEKSIAPATPTAISDADQELTSGQKQAWHKLLYGGLGILAVFIFFILLLYLRSRKRKYKQNT